MTSDPPIEELRRRQKDAELAALQAGARPRHAWLPLLWVAIILVGGYLAVRWLQPMLKPARGDSALPIGLPANAPQHAFRPGLPNGMLYYIDNPGDLATTDIFTRTIGDPSAVALNLTNTPDYSELLPSLAPNDDRVAYIAVSKGGDRSVRVLRAGSGPIDISSRIEKFCVVDLGLAPVWSPDGEWLAFLGACDRRNGKTVQLFAARSDGSELRALTNGDYQVKDAHWLDASTIIFAERHGTGAGAIYAVPLVNPTPTPLADVNLPE